MIEATVVLAPLREGETEAARAAIGALREPFARVPGTHLARVQVMEPWPGAGPHMLLAADHDGPLEHWLPGAARELDGVLGHCASWPGAGDDARALRWARVRRQSVGFSIVGSPDATVEQVGEALALRESLMRFTAETEGLDDGALQRAWSDR